MTPAIMEHAPYTMKGRGAQVKPYEKKKTCQYLEKDKTDNMNLQVVPVVFLQLRKICSRKYNVQQFLEILHKFSVVIFYFCHISLN